MKGGYFNYTQYDIKNAADILSKKIKSLDRKAKYSTEIFNTDTMHILKKTEKQLQFCAITLHRIDWLLSGDNSEKAFYKCLKNDMENLIKTFEEK